ncbi:MAG: proton-conducting transporter membrane subunit [Bacillota bacterium]|nr:proton-conducting transporter membrane subunit [Bacillota bacterium]MDW7677262.1 proton-conducting transporter membrane subunit [Bacillota bacterium]
MHDTHHLDVRLREEAHRGNQLEWHLSKKDMDVFDLNLILILTAAAFMAGSQFLFHGSGSLVMAFFSQLPYIPVLLVLLIFTAAPIGVYIGSKSEDYRDVFLVNVVFIALLLVLAMYGQIVAGPQLLRIPHILFFGLNFRVDRLTFLLVVAATVIWLLAMVFGHRYIKAEEKNRSRFYSAMIITYGCVMGGMMANDLFTMFLFFEIMYLSCYFIVSHSQTEEALSAGNRYIYMGIVGGLSMFLGICLIYAYTRTLMISDIRMGLEAAWAGNTLILTVAIISFLIGFIIKAAIFPLHFWLPNAHASAPSPASAVLSGMVIKVYIFSIMKFLFIVVGMDLFIAMGLLGIFAPLAVVGMIMGSVFAIGQTELKKMLAYSTVAQVGYMLLGIGLMSRMGLAASMFHIITHALMKSALFLSAGAILYQTGKKKISDFNGLGYQMPVTMGVFTVGALSMIGIPGFNGFMSKWYLGMAALEAGKPVFVLMILVSSFLNAMYYLPIVIAAFLKEDPAKETRVSLDQIPLNMMAPLVLLAAGCILFGLFPQLVMGFIQSAIASFYL